MLLYISYNIFIYYHKTILRNSFQLYNIQMYQDSESDIANKFQQIFLKNKNQFRKFRKPEISNVLLSSQDVSSNSTPISKSGSSINKKKQNYSQTNAQNARQIQELLVENQNILSENNSLQSYIKQLVAYINDSSQKYSDNIQKYGIAYKELYIKYTNLQESSDQEILLLKNELQCEREKVFNKDQEISQLMKKNKTYYEEVEQEIHRRQQTKEQLVELQKQGEVNKKIWNDVLQEAQKQIKKLKETIQQLNSQLKLKARETLEQKKQIEKLEVQLRKRQELPDKVIDREKEIISANVDLRNQRTKTNDLVNQFNLVKLQLSKSQKEREELRVNNAKLSGDFENYFRIKNKEHEDRWGEKEFKYQLQINQLKEQLERTKKQLLSEIETTNQLKLSVESKQREIITLNKRVKSEINEKQSYLDEFKVLKQNYQDVISNLETTVQDLQHKLWNTNDKNKQLQYQVDKFREMTYQLEYINNQNEKKQGTDYLKEEVEVYGLGDPVRLLRGEQDVREAEKVVQSKRKAFKEKDNRRSEEDDPWAGLMDKINSL